MVIPLQNKLYALCRDCFAPQAGAQPLGHAWKSLATKGRHLDQLRRHYIRYKMKNQQYMLYLNCINSLDFVAALGIVLQS